MKNAICKKAINFDLNVAALKKYYSGTTGKKYNNAYKEIRKFMESNGFIHRQGSGYVSKDRLSTAKIISFTQKLNKKFPWLSKCVEKMDVTDIGKQHDLTYLFGNRSPVKQQDIVSSTNTKKSVSGKTAPFNLAALHREIDKVKQQPHKSQPKKDKDINR